MKDETWHVCLLWTLTVVHACLPDVQRAGPYAPTINGLDYKSSTLFSKLLKFHLLLAYIVIFIFLKFDLKDISYKLKMQIIIFDPVFRRF